MGFNLHFANPFGQVGNWYKGCLHVHSTASDGDLSPGEVSAWYQARGYHFLALTDHEVLSEGQSFSANWLMLSGIEIERVDPSSGEYHIVGLGLSRPPDLKDWKTLPLQAAIDGLRAAGGLVVLAHPYWTGQMSKDLLDPDGAFALEIYNGGCEVDDAKGLSTVHWDDLLAANRRLWGLAVDDAHWRGGDRDAGLGWVWVRAPSLTQTAILSALEQGYFYASSGPQIHDLGFDTGLQQVHVRCSPAVAIDFVGNGEFSKRVSAPPGETLTEASYRPRKQQRYVRVACHDGRGGCAWSNPIFLEGAE